MKMSIYEYDEEGVKEVLRQETGEKKIEMSWSAFITVS